ncbi:MAG: DUF5317 domain-containing protein [Thermaerobacterales bacterium]
MFISFMAAALLYGLARGGRLGNLMNVQFTAGWLIVGAFLIRFSLGAVSSGPQDAAWLSTAAQGAAYSALVAAVYLNRRLPGLPTLGIGLGLNGMVIMANGGRMPVDPAAIEAAGRSDLIEALAAGKSLTHQLAVEGTQLFWLADIWTWPPPLPLAAVFSIGDVLIGIGGFVLIQAALRRPR